MQRKFVPLFILSLMALSCLLGWYAARTYHVAAAEMGVVSYYTCPMHPKYTSDRPGDCPSCGMRLVPVYSEDTASTVQGSLASFPHGTLNISSEKQQIIGVRTAAVKKVPLVYRKRVLGRVAADETKIVRLTSADGWVEEVYSGSADTVVQRNQLLAKFYSKDLISAQLSFLYNIDLPENLSKSRQDKSVAYILSRSADKELRSLGMSDYQMKEIFKTGQAVTDIEVRAPRTGYVMARNIYPGMKIERNMELFRIADLSRVWILADLYENEASCFRPGAEARVTLPQQGKVFRARVSNVLPQFDPVTRTLKVRLVTDNPGYALRPDMFVDVDMTIEKPPVIAVPTDAILYTGKEPHVFVDMGSGHFAPRTVQAGESFGDKTAVASGLAPGDRIVVSGAFLIDSESRMKPSDAPGEAQAAKSESVTDPVCGMTVDPDAMETVHTTYKSKTYYFCCEKCRNCFESHPDKYLQEEKMSENMRLSGASK